MKRLQISIAALILVIVVFAFVLTALRTASDLWYGDLYTFSAAILLTSVVASRFRRGNERAFWFGFAVFGWGFFLLGSGPWLSLSLAEACGQLARSITNCLHQS